MRDQPYHIETRPRLGQTEKSKTMLQEDVQKIVDVVCQSKQQQLLKGREEALRAVSPVLVWLSSDDMDVKDLRKWTLNLFEKAAANLEVPDAVKGTVDFYRDFHNISSDGSYPAENYLVIGLRYVFLDFEGFKHIGILRAIGKTQYPGTDEAYQDLAFEADDGELFLATDKQAHAVRHLWEMAEKPLHQTPNQPRTDHK